ncbi:MAG: M48 family metalloprotease [Deltaproteobacteria bacterium]|nr:M48 family metalloprotease [Deltaproteobacteria bacterium]
MRRTILIGIFLFFLAGGCLDGLNLFTIEDDKTLGAQVDAEIESDSADYPVLDEDDYASAYDYLNGIVDEILAVDDVQYDDEFVWQVHIINDDSVVNAFATPGGYLYFYTGLIKYLESEDSFAGVVGHEIAHADQRHVTDNLTKEYGISLLLDVVLGNRLDLVSGIALNLIDLSFSRDAEAEADEYSVIYLSGTQYACNAAADFFEKLLEEEDASSPPEFLSTHPSPENRVDDINAKADELDCDTTPSGNDYAAFQEMLP